MMSLIIFSELIHPLVVKVAAWLIMKMLQQNNISGLKIKQVEKVLFGFNSCKGVHINVIGNNRPVNQSYRDHKKMHSGCTNTTHPMPHHYQYFNILTWGSNYLC